MKDESAREGDGETLLLSRTDVAKLLNVSLSHFMRHVARELPVIRTGRTVRYLRGDVEAWIDAKRRETDVEPLTRAKRGTEKRTAPPLILNEQQSRLLESIRRRSASRELVIRPGLQLKRRESTLPSLDELRRGAKSKRG